MLSKRWISLFCSGAKEFLHLAIVDMVNFFPEEGGINVSVKKYIIKARKRLRRIYKGDHNEQTGHHRRSPDSFGP